MCCWTACLGLLFTHKPSSSDPNCEVKNTEGKCLDQSKVIQQAQINLEKTVALYQ